MLPDALLADLQNTVPGGHLNPVNGTANGTSGYGCLKGARRKEPQVSLVTNFDFIFPADDSLSYVYFTLLSRAMPRFFFFKHADVFVMFAHVTNENTTEAKWKFVVKILLWRKKKTWFFIHFWPRHKSIVSTVLGIDSNLTDEKRWENKLKIYLWKM